MARLELKHISKKLGSFRLNDINMELADGGYFVLLGHSGAGKSLILETIAGIIRPDEGEVWLNNQNITHEKIQNRRIGLVFQDLAIFPLMNVFENIAFPLRSRGCSRQVIEKEVQHQAELTGITSFLQRSPDSLSGGELQRVALARTLAMKPYCLLLDEPLSSLDIQVQDDLRKLLRSINQLGTTVLHVTHHFEEAISLASHVAVLDKGIMLQQGTPDEVFHHPKSKFIADFTGMKNFFSAKVTVSAIDGIAIVQVNNTQVNMVIVEVPEVTEGFILIRSTDIILSENETGLSTANNLMSTVLEIVPSGYGYEVLLDAGIPLYVQITAASQERLSLIPGKKIWACFKAPAVRLIA
jgi:molybdate transport system ATP-binding protein/molybdate/tungstate transport system ATP-binding protein